LSIFGLSVKEQVILWKNEGATGESENQLDFETVKKKVEERTKNENEKKGEFERKERRVELAL